MSARRTKYVFVTGGVASSLGKGITAASLGALLKARGLQGAGPEVRPVHQRRSGDDEPVPARRGVRHRGRRRDRSRHRPLRAVRRREPLPEREPHLGLDLVRRHPQGTQGRVPGLDRPGDPAHHERDQGSDPPRRRRRRRRRRDLARSAAPSATSSRCRSSRRSASSAARRGLENVLYIHVTLVPFIEAAGELKTKPTQHSVNELRRIGIHPDIVVCRSQRRRCRATSGRRSRSSPTSTRRQ